MTRTASFEKTYDRPLQIVVPATVHLEGQLVKNHLQYYREERYAHCKAYKAGPISIVRRGDVVVTPINSSCRAVFTYVEWRLIVNLRVNLVNRKVVYLADISRVNLG